MMRLDTDETLASEEEEAFPKRRPADAKLGANIDFPQTLARLQFASEDSAAQVFSHLIREATVAEWYWISDFRHLTARTDIVPNA